MPTLTFYLKDDVAKQLERVIVKRSRKLGITVSRGDLLTPHIRNLYKQEFPKNGNGNGKAHIVGASAPVEIKAESVSAVEEVKP